VALLATTLRPPQPRRRLVDRSRLTDRLRLTGGQAPRLVLVSAPAGFGKSKLLAQWLAAAEGSRRRVAWLALDDYHVIDDAAVHDAVTFLLDNLPRRSRSR
jgi:LuxR family maltose regulon positive regulatory protein